MLTLKASPTICSRPFQILLLLRKTKRLDISCESSAGMKYLAFYFPKSRKNTIKFVAAVVIDVLKKRNEILFKKKTYLTYNGPSTKLAIAHFVCVIAGS